MLQERLDEMQAMSLKEQKSSDSIHGEDQTDRLTLTIEDTLFPDLTEEYPCMSIGQLLRQALEDGSQVMNEFITSTWTKETIDLKICFYLKALHHTLGVTTRLMQSLKKTAPKSLNYYEWALYILTEMRGFINAATQNEKSNGHMGWHDILRNIECELHYYRDQVERYLANECSRKVLPQFHGLRGHSAESGTPRKEASRNAENGIGAADREGKGESNITAYSFDSLSSKLATNNDQYLFQPISNILLDDQGGQQISVRTDGKCSTLRAEMHGNVPLVMEPAVVCMATQQGGAEIRTDDKAPTITAAAGMSGNNQPVICLQGNGIDRADTAGCNGKGWREDQCYTLNTIDRPAVVYAVDQGGGESGANVSEDVTPTLTCTHGGEPVIAFDREAFNQGVNAQYDFEVTDSGIASTLVAKGPSGVAYKEPVNTYQKVTGPLMANSHPGSYTGQDAFSDMLVAGEQETQYIVRRLTPTECARLQGFPDLWGHFPEKEDFTDEEYAFWLDVRNTHAEINGKTVKEYTKEQMLTWYNKLHTDSAEYKMWGNGIALPPAVYCMQGIVEALQGGGAK